MVECTKCGYRNPEDAQFCGNPTGCRAFLEFVGKKVGTLPGGVSLSISQVNVTVEPGKEAICQVRLRNLSQIVEGYKFSVIPAWATIEPETISLFPDHEAEATVHFRPPRSSGLAAGAVPFAVTAESRTSSSISAIQSGSVDVGPFREMSVQLSPRTSHGTTTGVHRVAVENRGNVPLRVTLEPSDPDELLAFEVSPSFLVIEASKTGFAEVDVHPRSALKEATAQARPFQVRVQPDGASPAPAAAEALMIPEPVAPERKTPKRWWLPLLAASSIAAVVAAAILFLPGRLGRSAATPNSPAYLAANVKLSATTQTFYVTNFHPGDSSAAFIPVFSVGPGDLKVDHVAVDGVGFGLTANHCSGKPIPPGGGTQTGKCEITVAW